MTKSKYDWLHLLCGRSDDERINTPFGVTFGGLPHSCATNGHAMLMVQSDEFTTRDKAPDIHRAIHHNWSRHYNVSLDELKNWAFAAEHVCSVCENGCIENEVTIGDECYGYVQTTCTSCGGTGFQQIVYGRLAGTVINRKLLWDYLSPLNATGTVCVSVPSNNETALRLLAPHWQLWLMPCREKALKPSETVSEFITDEIATGEGP